MKNRLNKLALASALLLGSHAAQAQEITEFNVEPGACINVYMDWTYVNADRVVLQRRLASNPNFITLYTGGNTAFLDRTTQKNTTYVYRIQACQGASCSGYWSATATTNCQ